jgi:hypothetical protein
MRDTRQESSAKIIQAYKNADLALAEIGRLLRTTESGKFMWSSEHKTFVSGMRVAVQAMMKEVPRYSSE